MVLVQGTILFSSFLRLHPAAYPFQSTHLVSPLFALPPIRLSRLEYLPPPDNHPSLSNPDRQGPKSTSYPILAIIQRTRNPTDCGRRPTSSVRAGERAGGDAVGMKGRRRVAPTYEVVVCVFLMRRRQRFEISGLTTDTSREWLGLGWKGFFSD